MTKFSITRQKIKEIALSMRGVPFLHQGRDPRTGLDCVGLLVALGQKIGYPEIFDVEGYRRTPSANVIKSVLGQNCDEIPIEQAGVGDIFLMRMHGRKPRHTSILIEDAEDLTRNIQPAIIHANYDGVRVDLVANFPAAWYVAGFRVRGLEI